eukprot:scaffold1014_cov260-Pinguiococcus_pyrenoidosus.AAC.17
MHGPELADAAPRRMVQQGRLLALARRRCCRIRKVPVILGARGRELPCGLRQSRVSRLATRGTRLSADGILPLSLSTAMKPRAPANEPRQVAVAPEGAVLVCLPRRFLALLLGPKS